MINNRQAGRRNRGRSNNNSNNGRPNNQNRGGGDSGNRIDSRARGNATQLLEKYRNMARDSQLAGDRVNTEYYLQFADHYFRVLADNRARQEEAQGSNGQQQIRQRPEPSYDEFGDEYDNGDAGTASEYEDRAPQQQVQRDIGRDGGRDAGRDGSRDGNRDAGRENGRESNRDGNRDAGRDNGRDSYRDQPRNDRQPYPNRDDLRGNDNRGNTEPRDLRNDRYQPRRDDQRREEAPRREDQRRAPQPVAQESVNEAPPVSAAPVEPRRRGRPPKVRPEASVETFAATPPETQGTVEEAGAPRRGPRPRRPREENDGENAGLDLAVLPPAIARAEADNDGDVAAEEAPRKRVRRTRPAAEAAE